MSRLLIVDDQPEVSRLLELVLREEHREILLAGSGEEALRIARERHPDLVLLDIMMPGMDGYQVARSLRASPETRSCSILVMTAKTREADRQEAFAAGADDFIVKPFDVLEIRQRVESLLS